jgi:cell pole-organizing protein PopZ
MEDILASIRRILSEDEAPAGAGTQSTQQQVPGEGADDGVLVLDPSMMVSDPANEAEPLPTQPTSTALTTPEAPPSALVAPEAAAAAAVSVSSLVRTLTDRAVQVHSGGPTVEDIVREELRPLLKSWLDANLPSLVERLVRAEIERVVGRVVP